RASTGQSAPDAAAACAREATAAGRVRSRAAVWVSRPGERIGSRFGNLREDVSIGVVKRLRLAPNHQHGVLVVGPGAVGVDRDLDPVLDGLEGIFEERIRANSVHISEPRVATSSKLVSSLAARPNAIATCPRGMARVWMRLPVAGSQ